MSKKILVATTMLLLSISLSAQTSIRCISVAEALRLSASLAPGAMSNETYVIMGYITGMVNASDGGYAQYGNQIFWIADKKNGGTSNAAGAFEVYQGVANQELFVQDRVFVITKLRNYNGLIESETRATAGLCCGENLYWSILSGVLTISGTGEMYNKEDYINHSYSPWDVDRSIIKEVVIEDGVTSIGRMAFERCTNIEKVTLGTGIENILDEAFYNCNKITSVTIYAQTPPMSRYAFSYTTINSATLYVPCSAFSAYKVDTQNSGISLYGGMEPAQTNWCGFNNIRVISEFNYEVRSSDNSMGTVTENWVDCNWIIEAKAQNGHKFVRWSDGNTENPRTIILAQDIVLTAEFEKYSSNQCGDNLYYTLTDGNLVITGYGPMADYNDRDYESPFYYNYDIRTVSFPEGMTSIGDYAFYGCNNLISVTIPNGVNSIGDFAFYSCSHLETVTVHALTPPQLGMASFNYGNYAPIFYVPCFALPAYQGTQEHIALYGSSYNLQEWSDFEFIGISEFSIELLSQDYSMGDVRINSQPDCDNVTEIEAIPEKWHAFVRWSDGNTENPRTLTLTQNTILTAEFAPYDRTSGKCGDNLYWTCANGEVVITGTGPMYNYRYDYSPFTMLADEITSITCRPGMTTIGSHAFSNCVNLKSLVIPNTVTEIPYLSVIDNCENIQEIEVPAALLGYFVDFEETDITKLKKVVVNSGIIDSWPMLLLGISHNLTLEVLDLAKTDNTALNLAYFDRFNSDNVGDYDYLFTFRNLTTLILPHNLQSIDYLTFANCIKLKEISIPASVTQIDDRAFEDCRSLSALTFEPGSQLRRIGNWSFYNCHNLKTITIPDGVTEIGDAAFFDCVYATELKIPATVNMIGDNAFSQCSKINKMYVDAVLPPAVEASTFYDVSRTAPVYVPSESVSLYKADPVWGQLNIVSNGETTTGIDNLSEPNTSAQKLMYDGKVYILRNNHIYTVGGIEVK